MRLAPLAIAPFATALPFASRARNECAGEHDSLTEAQAEKIRSGHVTIENDPLGSRRQDSLRPDVYSINPCAR
jgi:hypothetical protein